MASENIVQTSIDCVAPTGERFTASVEIGRPYCLPDGHWACSVRIRGLYDNLADIHGEDSLQALCLAASLVRLLLRALMEDGGRLLHPNTNDSYDLDATFGSLGTPSNRRT